MAQAAFSHAARIVPSWCSTWRKPSTERKCTTVFFFFSSPEELCLFLSGAARGRTSAGRTLTFNNWKRFKSLLGAKLGTALQKVPGNLMRRTSLLLLPVLPHLHPACHVSKMYYSHCRHTSLGHYCQFGDNSRAKSRIADGRSGSSLRRNLLTDVHGGF